MQNSIGIEEDIHNAKATGGAHSVAEKEKVGGANSVGMVEVTGSANAIYVVDVMLKAAGVCFTSWETVFGIGRVTVFVQGDVASVTAAVEAVKKNEKCAVFASYVIANPHSVTRKFLLRSEKKLSS